MVDPQITGSSRYKARNDIIAQGCGHGSGFSSSDRVIRGIAVLDLPTVELPAGYCRCSKAVILVVLDRIGIRCSSIIVSEFCGAAGMRTDYTTGRNSIRYPFILSVIPILDSDLGLNRIR